MKTPNYIKDYKPANDAANRWLGTKRPTRPPEQPEGLYIQDIAVANYCDKLEAQRDELLAALERIKSKLGEHEGKGDKRAGELIVDAYFEAKTAIAKCEAQP